MLILSNKQSLIPAYHIPRQRSMLPLERSASPPFTEVLLKMCKLSLESINTTDEKCNELSLNFKVNMFLLRYMYIHIYIFGDVKTLRNQSSWNSNKRQYQTLDTWSLSVRHRLGTPQASVDDTLISASPRSKSITFYKKWAYELTHR